MHYKRKVTNDKRCPPIKWVMHGAVQARRPLSDAIRHGIGNGYIEIFSPDRNTLTEGPSREEIAQRAYELYLARGGADGSEQEDWLQAERELQQ